MKDIAEVTACVVEHGLNVPLATALVPHYKRVLYCNPSWATAFPKLNTGILGTGYPGVEVIDDFWDYKDEIDLFVFPDLYHAGEQLELESQGKAVWGSRHGDKMEIYREYFMRTLEKVGLEVPQFEVVQGVTALRDYLKDKEDCYIKISKWRGTLETTHWRDWGHDESLLDYIAMLLGPAKEQVRFLVFDAIDTDIEIGCDTYCIDGQFPDTMVEGYEWKDKAYLGTVRPVSEMPEQLIAVNEAFKDELSAMRYRNLISSEVRIKDDKFYFIDPTRRFPCPAGTSQLKLYANLGEIIWAGGNGELVQPVTAAQFSVETALTVKGDKTCWMVAEFPEDLADNIACGFTCRIDGKTCSPPNGDHEDTIGWLVNIGDTPRDTINGLLEMAKELPDGVSACTECLVDLLKEIESGEEKGIDFTEKPMPAPAEVIEG